MALSIVNTTSAHPAHLGFNPAPPSLDGTQPSAGPDNDAAGGPVATAVPTTDAVKPTPLRAGARPVALDAQASVRFATNPVSTGPAAASASDYAKAIAAYTRQSIVGGGPSSSDTTSGNAPKVAAAHAAGPHAGHAIGGTQAHQVDEPQAAESNLQATARSASGGVADNDNTDAAAPKADATPPAASLEAGGQAHPIAAPTAHAVMSLLKMI